MEFSIGALLTRHICRGDASMLQRHVVVLDAQMALQERTIIARDIARRIHVRCRFQVFVHYHAVINGEPGSSGQFGVRGNAYAHRDQVGGNFIAGVRHHCFDAPLFSHETRRRGIGEYGDALLARTTR